ncbi:hypothetical protein P879_01838 [Paragonimus westermani]|uniref:BAR domain-containing protein n=1 Tax=Paragonimus westermani TaxID=34504 RepID=A0A8T0DU21_9TREM|nr:hypothetical protein P879_01838 [Paragonimus westermani]
MPRSTVSSIYLKDGLEEDPQYVVGLTSKQKQTANKIKEDTSTFLSKVSQTTSVGDRLLESLLEFLDPSWDATGNISSTTSEIHTALNDLTTGLNNSLPYPMNDQVKRYKVAQSQFHIWKDHQNKLNRKMKTYQNAKAKGKDTVKLEKARREAQEALRVCENESAQLNAQFMQLNTDGVIACCETWFILIDKCTDACNRLASLLRQLRGDVSVVHDLAINNTLPTWVRYGRSTSYVRDVLLNDLSSTKEDEDIGQSMAVIRRSYVPRIMSVDPGLNQYGRSPYSSDYPSLSSTKQRYRRQTRHLSYPSYLPVRNTLSPTRYSGQLYAPKSLESFDNEIRNIRETPRRYHSLFIIREQPVNSDGVRIVSTAPRRISDGYSSRTPTVNDRLVTIQRDWDLPKLYSRDSANDSERSMGTVISVSRPREKSNGLNGLYWGDEQIVNRHNSRTHESLSGKSSPTKFSDKSFTIVRAVPVPSSSMDYLNRSKSGADYEG